MRIYDGRNYFYQWDTDQKITHKFNVGDEVHFYNMKQRNALPVAAYELDGEVVADVPNILLQSAYPIHVYWMRLNKNGRYTREDFIFKVKQRPKPDDYAYTETEILHYSKLDERLTNLEGEGIAEAVNEYMEANPIEETDPTVPEWAKAESKPTYTADEVGAQPKALRCTITYWAGVYSCDKTFEEMLVAHESGMDVLFDTPMFKSVKGLFYETTSGVTEVFVVYINGQIKYEFRIEKDNSIKYRSYTFMSKETWLAHGTGTDDTKVMTQKATTEAIESLTAEDVGALPDTTEIPVVPSKLPNPNALTFTGAVSATYDGSSPVSVEIPQGGGGGESEWVTILDGETAVDNATALVVDLLSSGYEEYRVHLHFGKDQNADTTLSNCRFDVTVDGNRIGYYTLSANLDNYEPHVFAHIFPFPNKTSGGQTKMAHVDFWQATGPDTSAGTTKNMLCWGSNHTPSGKLNIVFGSAYTGTVKYKITAK